MRWILLMTFVLVALLSDRGAIGKEPESAQLLELNVSIWAGDPDGSLNKGTKRILAEAKVVTQEKRAADYYFPGRPEDIAPGKPCVRVRLAGEFLKGQSIRLFVEQEEVTAANPIRRVETKEAKRNEKFQFAQIPYGVGMIWIEVLVRDYKR